MIEKRISYEEDNGRKNVKVAGIKNSSIYKLLKNPKVIGIDLGNDTILEIINLIQSSGLVKKPLPKDWQPKYLNGNVIDMVPLIDDEWWKIERPEPNDDETKKREGIMQVASVEDDMDREFYGGLLSPIYGADYIESLPIPKLKELFDEYLRNTRIG